MALAERSLRNQPKGRAKPRIAPPVPARSLVKEFTATAAELGYELMPWQQYAGRFLTGLRADGRWLYREVAIVVARRNGKTMLLLPRILMALRAGEKVLHTAQDRVLPREIFEELAEKLVGSPEVDYIRWANGQETIKFKNGGRYTLVAPNHGIRGRDADLIIVDEVREQHDDRVARAILPTAATSLNGQIIYLSNAGDGESVMLNELRRRKDEAGRLAYLEWSAAPERGIDDLAGWAEANPALGHTLMVETLAELRKQLSLPAFETEHLCRWVISSRELFVDPEAWRLCEAELGEPRRAYMGLSMDPDGKRASAALAWRLADNRIALRSLLEGTGDSIVTDDLGPELRQLAAKNHVVGVGYGPDELELAKFLPKSQKIGEGAEFAGASGRLVMLVQSHQLRHDDADAVTDDLDWTSRKTHDETGRFIAVRADDERPITAALAAIRAVWLASGPAPTRAEIH